MRLMFVYWYMGGGGSAQDIHHYARAAEALGHEVVLYGPRPRGEHLAERLIFTRDAESADLVAFICEWTTDLRDCDALDLLRLIERVPRERRIVIDCDGGYNDPLSIHGDYNHRDAAASRHWIETCDIFAERVYQPTHHPLRPNVRTFYFHAYDRTWEQPLDFSAKPYGMIYIGHSKFRWGPMERVLRAVEPVRSRVGRIGIVGHGWDALPVWAEAMLMVDAYYTDPTYMAQLGVEVTQAIPFNQVLRWMSKAVFNPVIYRPLFEHLGFVPCRTFETPAASTIPLFGLGADHVREIYGEAALELALPAEHPEEKLYDLLDRPEHYAGIVEGIRLHLTEHHSYEARLRELIAIARGER